MYVRVSLTPHKTWLPVCDAYIHSPKTRKPTIESNWAPRILCRPIDQFKPCLEDYGCRSILDAVRDAVSLELSIDAC